MTEWLYTPSLKATEKHTKAGADRPEEILAYPVHDKDDKPTGQVIFDDDRETVLEKDHTVGLPVIWYKVEVIRKV